MKIIILIREIRQKENITLDELSRRTKISKGHLSCIERGEKEPKVWRAMDIVKALNVDINDILKTIN